MRIVDKAFAYVTNGEHLLVFRHADFPEAGIQVPAGTIQPGEAPLHAVLREVREESGPEAFLDVRPLATVEFDARTIGKDELHRRHFYHLRVAGSPPASWRHFERHGGGPEPFAFDFFWLRFAEAEVVLCGEHGKLLGA